MSSDVMTCADARELAPELALGILSGAERAEVVLHVNGCARCQAYVTELTEAADVIPQLVPEEEPPVGFEGRVLRRLGEGERRTRRRWIAAVAAVAAAAIIVSITAVRVIESNDGTGQSAARGATTTTVVQRPVAVVMEGGGANGDSPAGWAYVMNRHGVAVSVDYGIPAGTYAVRVDPNRGDATVLGSVHVDSGRGSWTGRSDAPLGPGSTISLVDASGNEVCRGTVPIAE
jgi:hypothetical protein